MANRRNGLWCLIVLAGVALGAGTASGTNAASAASGATGAHGPSAAGAPGAVAAGPAEGAPAAASLPPQSAAGAPTPAAAVDISNVAGERRLTLAAGTMVRLAITPSPADMVVRMTGAAGAGSEDLLVPGGGAQPLQLSWLIARDGEVRFTAVPRAGAGTTAGPVRVAFAVIEERPEAPCDAARARAERALLAARVALAETGEGPAARASALLAAAGADVAAVGEDEMSLAVALQAARAEGHLGHTAAATALYGRAAEQARALGDRRSAAEALGERAWLLPRAAQRQALDTALELRRQVGEETGLAETLFELGVHHANSGGAAAQALQSFRQALALQWRNDDVPGAAWSLGEIGALQDDAATARAYLDLALQLSQGAGDLEAQGNALEKSAYLHLLQGELAAAAADFAADERLLAAAGKRLAAARALAGEANTALYLGDNDRALRAYRQALGFFTELGAADGRATALLGIGHALTAQGQDAAATGYLQQGLRVARDGGLQQVEAVALYGLGRVHARLGRLPEATAELSAALARQDDSDDHSHRAQVLVELGQARGKAGDLTAAGEAFQEAIRLGGGMPLVEASAQSGLARLERERGDLQAARTAIGRALALTEQLRAGLVLSDQRISFLDSRRSYYELNVDLLLRLDRQQPGAGHDAEALAASEQARARGLLDLLAERRIEVRRGVPAELRQRETALGERLERLQGRLLSPVLSLPPAEIQRLDDELSRAFDEEKDLEAEIRSRDPAYAAMRAPLPPRLPEVQRLLDERQALLEFFVGAEGGALFVVTREGLFTHPLPPRAVIAGHVAALRAETARNSRLRARQLAAESYELYRLLLLPAAAELRGKPSWLVAPDGPLYALNFEQLLTAPPAGQAAARGLPYLLRERSIAYVPSAAVLAQLLTRPATAGAAAGGAGKQFVGFAAPSAGVPGAAGAPATPATPATNNASRAPGPAAAPGAGPGRSAVLAELPALPAALEEVHRIAGLFPPGEAAVLTGPDATEEAVRANPLVVTAHILHFAVHSLLNEKQPELSGLVLGAGGSGTGLLSVPEIFNLQLGAGLVVLSACNSGLGKEAFGEGLTGMTSAFLYAGAGSVVVSLWAVDDESTAALMVSFYGHLRASGDAAEALRSAKLEMIERSPYGHPFYWAPFLLIGRPR